MSSKRQLNLYKKLSQFPNVLFVNPLISAQRVIDNSKAVISMPFTSTAHYGKNNGKQSVYYDPCNWIRADDKAAQGVPIYSTSEHLEEWIKNLVKE